MHDILFKQFQKAPENPYVKFHSPLADHLADSALSRSFNQVNIAHNATKEERVQALQHVMAEKEKKYQA